MEESRMHVSKGLKRFASNLRHQRQATRVQGPNVAPRFAKICGSGFSRNALLIAALLMAGTAAGAAEEKQRERLIACFKEVKVPAKYEVSKVLIEKPKRYYVRRNGRVELVEYPAVYREDKKLLEPAHVVMREIVCN